MRSLLPGSEIHEESYDSRKPVFGFPTRSVQPLQSQKRARSLDIDRRVLVLSEKRKQKVLISSAVTAQLLCTFVFHICKNLVFS